MIIKQRFLSKKHCSRPGLPLYKPTAIVLYFVDAFDPVTTHYEISSKGEVVQKVPEHEVVRHSHSKLDYSTISFRLSMPLSIDSLYALKELRERLNVKSLQLGHGDIDWEKFYNDFTIL
mgnify:FL=1